MTIRTAGPGDLEALLGLYTHLHDNPSPEIDGRIRGIWGSIMSDPNHQILLGVKDGEAVSSCVLLIVPNLTRGQRPYALIENVVTHAAHREKGYGSRILARARDLAQEAGCYKIMLMTGAKEESTLRFYGHAGYNRDDKTAFVMWL